MLSNYTLINEIKIYSVDNNQYNTVYATASMHKASVLKQYKHYSLTYKLSNHIDIQHAS